MDIVSRLLNAKNQEKYCLDAKPEDFYYSDGKNAFLNYDNIDRALEAARITFSFGSQKAALLLICKLCDGYRRYNNEKNMPRQNR